MEEISFWVHTRRAPCLMNYENMFKAPVEQKPAKARPAAKVPSPVKKKRKLSILDDSLSLDKHQNVYFEAPQQNRPNVLSSCKSGSDIDFNIKKSSVQVKPKRLKLQKNSRTTLHKKNKVVTSTPKVSTALRRSLRKVQNSLNNNSQLDTSYEMFDPCLANGNNTKSNSKYGPKITTNNKSKRSTGKLANACQNVSNKKTVKPENGDAGNGQFEDMSDVSGFTANYIRSTKVRSSKTPRNLRTKGGRNLMKESQNFKEDNDTLVCTNKCINTAEEPPPAVLNCSTDSSQNVINLITVQNNGMCNKTDKSTSLLKFMDPKAKTKDSDINNETQETSKAAFHNSFETKSSNSRYPKRHRKDMTAYTSDTTQLNRSPTKRKVKYSKELNKSDRKENPDDSISRTRSGKNIGLTLHRPENSIHVINNSTEQDSSMVTMNVAAPADAEKAKDTVKRNRASHVKCMDRAINCSDKSGRSLQRDSLRDQSGFAACFSDSDEGSDALKQRKFFC